MAIKIQNYIHSRYYQAVSNFLIANYLPNNNDGNWLQPRWEYMHYRSDIVAKIDTTKIGVWEDNEKIIGVAHPEEYTGELYLQIHPEYTFLKSDMLDYAEKYLYGIDEQGRKFINLFVYDTDYETISIVTERGYTAKDTTEGDFLSQYSIPTEFPQITLPEGFRLKSLEEENDPHKV